jgi:hypothetical protein
MLTITIAQNTVFKLSTASAASLPPSQKANITKGKSFQVKSYLLLLPIAVRKIIPRF